MASIDLTSLSDVKAWLGRSDSNSDSLLSALITRTSRQILSYLRRPLILPHDVREIRDGTGGNTLLLKQWPVITVSTVTVGTLAIPPASALSPQPLAMGNASGWTCETWDGTPPGRQQVLSLDGYTFGTSYPGAQNNQNVLVAYHAGYQVTNEVQAIAGGKATVSAPFGSWASDGGVTYANGTAFTPVANSPSIGQYALDTDAGTYDFNSGDNGQSILVTYGFIPADLADACIELVSERFKYSERIGERSHSLGGNETVSFDLGRFTPLVTAMLQPYRNALPT